MRGRVSDPRTFYDAHCADCGAAFRIPSVDRTYSCRSCGGVVGVPRTCDECGGVNEPGSAFCDACGEALTAEARPPEPVRDSPARDSRTPRGRVRRHPARRDERELAARAEFHEMLRAIRNVQTLLLVQAVGATLIGILLVFGWIEVAREDYRAGRSVDFGGPFLVYIAALAFPAASWLGVIHGRWAPRFWALVSAVCTTLMTLAVVWLEFGTPTPVPMGLWLVGFGAAVAWVAVVRLAPLGRRLEQHRDLSIAELLREGGVVRNRHQRRPKRPGWLPTVVALMLVVGSAAFGAWTYTPPSLPSVEESAARFESAWAQDDSKALSDAFPGSIRIFGRMDRLSTVEAWGGDFPELGPRRDLKTGHEAMTSWWETDRGTLRVVWRLENGAWRPRTLALPEG